MAEFSEVMRQWRRFCKSHNHCGECDFDGKGICGEAHLSDIPFEKIERVIMAWAAEHPEPVYPTWCEWLHDLGLIVQKEGIFTEYGPNEIMCMTKKADVLTIKGYKSIPADIAQKLGIEPKEG